MLKTMRVVTLTENTVSANGFHAEWGLSLYAETEEGNFLLDTGNGTSAIENAERLCIDLGKIDKLVLSHSHADHTGGLRDFLRRRNKEIEIIAHPDVFNLTYVGKNGENHFRGIPFRREELESLGAKFTLTAEPMKLSESILTTGEVPMVTDFEKIVDNVLRKEGAEMVPDEVKDDLSIVFKTNHGLVVMLGCSHRGVVNHLLHARKISGMKEIHTVIGGCHLFNASKEQVDKTVDALKEFDIQQLGVSHCTGMKASYAMMEEFGDRFYFNNAGTVKTIPAGAGQ